MTKSRRQFPSPSIIIVSAVLVLAILGVAHAAGPRRGGKRQNDQPGDGPDPTRQRVDDDMEADDEPLACVNIDWETLPGVLECPNNKQWVRLSNDKSKVRICSKCHVPAKKQAVPYENPNVKANWLTNTSKPDTTFSFMREWNIAQPAEVLARLSFLNPHINFGRLTRAFDYVRAEGMVGGTSLDEGFLGPFVGRVPCPRLLRTGLHWHLPNCGALVPTFVNTQHYTTSTHRRQQSCPWLNQIMYQLSKRTERVHQCLRTRAQQMVPPLPQRLHTTSTCAFTAPYLRQTQI